MDDEVYINDALVFRRGSLNQSVTTTDHLPGFKCLRGWDGEYDDHLTLLVSNNSVSVDPDPTQTGRFMNVWLIIRVDDNHLFGDPDDPEWRVSLRALYPKSVGDTQLRMALDTKGLSLDDFLYLSDEEKHEVLVEALVDAGFSAPLATFLSDDANAAVIAAKQESVLASSTLNFYLQRKVNPLGNTGWDFLQGDV